MALWCLLLVAAVVAVVVLGHLGAKVVAARIRTHPDTYPLEILRREPQGETVFIDRPDGTRLRAITAGHGSVVILAHGYGITLQEWNVVFDQLVQLGFRVIAFDQRGHGGSTIGAGGIGSHQMAGDYEAVLAHFDVRDAILVGHSMGGFLSLVFLLTAPEAATQRLKGIVLLAATAGDVLRGSIHNCVQVPLIKWGVIQRIVRSRTYGPLFGRSLCGDRPSPAAIRAFLGVFGSQNHHALVPIIEALGRDNYYPRLGEIRVPCVVICGTKDRTTPPWHSQRLGRDVTNARTVWVEGKGHLLNWEAPETLVDAVRSLQSGPAKGQPVNSMP